MEITGPLNIGGHETAQDAFSPGFAPNGQTPNISVSGAALFYFNCGTSSTGKIISSNSSIESGRSNASFETFKLCTEPGESKRGTDTLKKA